MKNPVTCSVKPGGGLRTVAQADGQLTCWFEDDGLTICFLLKDKKLLQFAKDVQTLINDHERERPGP